MISGEIENHGELVMLERLGKAWRGSRKKVGCLWYV
jgi:hypothetical protein